MTVKTLKERTDSRLLIIAGIEYVELTPFSIIVAHNGHEIVDELIFPYSDPQATMRKINELTELYGKYTPDLCELQTDDMELMRLAVSMAGVFVRPKRRKDIELFTKRTLTTYTADGAIYDLYDIEPLEDPLKRSKIRTWLINVLQTIINKLEGERK